MFKKAILVVLCLISYHECNVIQNVIQPKISKNTTESFTGLISDGIEKELKKCNVNTSDGVLNLCRWSFRPLQKTANYFGYPEAVCVTLYDSVERLCNQKKLPKLELEESNPTVKNVSAFCSNMRSAINDSLSYTKSSEGKEWISELKNRLNDEQMCKDACIHMEKVEVVVNPVCSTLLQINAHFNLYILEKQNTSETSGGAEKTSISKNEDVQAVSNIQKAAKNLRVEGTQKEFEAVPENTSVGNVRKLDIQQVQHLNDQQDPLTSGQEGGSQGPALNKHSPKETGHPVSITSKTENNDKVDKKENIKHKSGNGKKHAPATTTTTTTTNTTTTTTVKDNINKQASDIQETNNNQVINQQPSSNDLEIKDLPKIKMPSLNPDDHNKGLTSNKSSTDTKENVKEPEREKQLPIAGETDEKVDTPSSKPADINKETNMDKPPIDTEDDGITFEASKGKISDVKTENSPEVPQDSKIQNSDKLKITNDSSTKKVLPPKTDETESAQGQSPDTDLEITDKDQNIFDGNIFNEDTGDNQGPIDLDGENNLGPDDDDDDDIMTQKTNTLPEIDDDIGVQEKGAYMQDKFINAEDSHFFAYSMTMMIICIVGYLVYHNKQKILALALEGRSRRSTRRRPNTSGYRKLDSNLEEAVTSACSTSVTHVIY